MIFGGIFAVTTGYWFHWGFVEDWIRFLSLLIAMAVLVLISCWRLRPPMSDADRSSGV